MKRHLATILATLFSLILILGAGSVWASQHAPAPQHKNHHSVRPADRHVPPAATQRHTPRLADYDFKRPRPPYPAYRPIQPLPHRIMQPTVRVTAPVVQPAARIVIPAIPLALLPRVVIQFPW
ncbi:MAG: hypothetical protein JXR59_10385 [Desulfuromonadaceae bacterium]|nr:hypothetical protein [Desulfuromonadaceae bacterium]